jgi:ABC-type Fe3+-hydroxamate transport system substrate-binding protein
MVSKKTGIDQMGRTVVFNYLPKRIVSLVPSQTELLYHLGLTDEVVGQTLFCLHPENMHKSKPRVGGTKNFKIEKIMDLQPDLVIGNKEENDQGRIETLMQQVPVWMSDIQTLDDALEMIEKVGALVGKAEAANLLASSIRTSFEELDQTVRQSFSKPIPNDGVSQDTLMNSAAQQTENGKENSPSRAKPRDNKPITENRKLKTAYFIWRKPWMVAGHETFIADILNRLGFDNVFAPESSRYPEVTGEHIRAAKLDLILLSSEPYPFKDEHIQELKQLAPQATILLVDGELFSWYGSRLIHSAAYFQGLLQAVHASFT